MKNKRIKKIESFSNNLNKSILMKIIIIFCPKKSHQIKFNSCSKNQNNKKTSNYSKIQNNQRK